MGGFSSKGKVKLVRVTGKINSKIYQKMLDDDVLYEINALHGDNFIFQQDNAPLHKSKDILDFLKSRNISPMDWPAKSPDLNPIENIGQSWSKKYMKAEESTPLLNHFGNQF